MPSHNGNHEAEKVARDVKDTATSAANGAAEKAENAADKASNVAGDAKEKGKQTAENVKESAKGAVDDTKKNGGSYIDQAKQAAAPYVDQAKQTTAMYVDQAKQAAAPYVDQAKQTTATYVDHAKQAAAPYVDGARNAVESTKEKAQSMKRDVDGHFKKAQGFDITKTTFFTTIVVMMGTVLATIWRCVEAVSPVRKAAVTIRDKSAEIGLSGKLWEGYYYSTVMLEHVPVVGYRSAEVIRTYEEEVIDEARKQIRNRHAEASKKAN